MIIGELQSVLQWGRASLALPRFNVKFTSAERQNGPKMRGLAWNQNFLDLSQEASKQIDDSGEQTLSEPAVAYGNGMRVNRHTRPRKWNFWS
jgi:hypothetical protein